MLKLWKKDSVPGWTLSLL